MMKTIFLIVPTVQRIDSLLRTEMLGVLRAKAKIVIISPLERENFLSEIAQNNVFFEQLKHLKFGFIRKNFLRLRGLFLKADTPRLEKEAAIMKSVVARRFVNAQDFKNRVLKILRYYFKPVVKIALKFFDKLEEIIFCDREYKKIFKKYEPQAMIVGTLGGDRYDIPWMAIGRENRARIFVSDLSWNYLDDRLFSYPRQVSKIFAWNEWWEKTLQKEYLVGPGKISVVGSARYDRLRGQFNFERKSEFFSKNGLDSQKKLITFAIGAEEWHPFKLEVIEFILAAIKTKQIAFPSQLLVRIGPKQKKTEKYYHLKNQYEDFFVEEADKNPAQSYVWNLLHSSDVVLSIFSSLALDAALMDKPMIYIGFTTPKNHPFNNILKKIFDFETIKQALDTGGVDVAFDENNFIKKLNSALQSPGILSDGRKRLIAKFLGEKTKPTGRQTAEEILESIKKSL